MHPQAALPALEDAPNQGIRWKGEGTGEIGTAEGRRGGAHRATDAAMSIWKRASSRLFDLESKIILQACP